MRQRILGKHQYFGIRTTEALSNVTDDVVIQTCQSPVRCFVRIFQQLLNNLCQLRVIASWWNVSSEIREWYNVSQDHFTNYSVTCLEFGIIYFVNCFSTVGYLRELNHKISLRMVVRNQHNSKELDQLSIRSWRSCLRSIKMPIKSACVAGGRVDSEALAGCWVFELVR